MYYANMKRVFEHTSNENVVEVCKPLENLKITFFLFSRNYADGSQAWLTNRPEWESYFHENKLYKMDSFRKNALQVTQPFYLWKCMPCQDIFSKAREFNIDHGITLIDKKERYVDTWHFGTETKQHGIYEVYLNKMDLLERFTHYFRDHARSLIDKAENVKVTYEPPTTEDGNLVILQPFLDSVDYEGYLQKTLTKRWYLGDKHGNTYLTQREIDCLYWLRYGKSAEEIGIILDISTSTAQSHIENVKKKLDCYKQFELGFKIAKLRLFPN